MSFRSKAAAILLAASLVAPLHALAQQSDFCSPGYTVGFFNSVFNTQQEARQALLRVKNTIGPTWNDQPVEYQVFYNQSGKYPARREATLFEDIAEVMRQKDSELNGLLKGRWEMF